MVSVSITNILVAVLVVAGIGLFAFAFLGVGGNQELIPNANGAALVKSPENFQKFASAELQDKCKTPPGYSDEDWQQHMGHHPDRYTECL